MPALLLPLALIVPVPAARAQAFSTLLAFGANDGSPTSALIQGSDGFFYGTTGPNGAQASVGAVFKMDVAGTNYTVLHSFGATDTDGQYPEAALIQGSDGYFYGTTNSGGAKHVRCSREGERHGKGGRRDRW